MRKSRFGRVPVFTSAASTALRAAKAGSCVEAADRLEMQSGVKSTMPGKRVFKRAAETVEALCGRGFLRAMAENNRLRSIARAVEKPSAKACIRAAMDVGGAISLAPDPRTRASAETVAAFVEKQCSERIWDIAARKQQRTTQRSLVEHGAKAVPHWAPDQGLSIERRTQKELEMIKRGEMRAERMTDAALRNVVARLREGRTDADALPEPVFRRVVEFMSKRADRTGPKTEERVRSLIAPTPRRGRAPRVIRRR